MQNSGLYGTFQLDQIISHTHGIGNVAPNGSSTPGSTGSGNFTAATGGVETRPVNATVNWFIKY
jgi:hypothetical protein